MRGNGGEKKKMKMKMKAVIVWIIIMAILGATTSVAMARENTVIRNEIQTSKVIIMLVDDEAYNDRRHVIAPVYILGCKTRDLGIINSVSADVPNNLLRDGFLNSPKIKKIVPDREITIPKPPRARYPIYPK